MEAGQGRTRRRGKLAAPALNGGRAGPAARGQGASTLNGETPVGANLAGQARDLGEARKPLARIRATGWHVYVNALEG